MSDRQNAVIDGTYSDFKLVKTRSVFQMVIEGPIERAAEAIAMFGVPQPGQEIHVAVARLTCPAPAAANGPGTAPDCHNTDAVPGRDAAKSERAKANFRNLPEMKKDVVRAVMLIKDVTFQGWLLGPRQFANRPSEELEAWTNLLLKDRLGIASKAEIGEDPHANERWRRLESSYLADTNQLAQVRG